jgi:hypothetical protein
MHHKHPHLTERNNPISNAMSACSQRHTKTVAKHQCDTQLLAFAVLAAAYSHTNSKGSRALAPVPTCVRGMLLSRPLCKSSTQCSAISGRALSCHAPALSNHTDHTSHPSALQDNTHGQQPSWHCTHTQPLILPQNSRPCLHNDAQDSFWLGTAEANASSAVQAACYCTPGPSTLRPLHTPTPLQAMLAAPPNMRRAARAAHTTATRSQRWLGKQYACSAQTQPAGLALALAPAAYSHTNV